MPSSFFKNFKAIPHAQPHRPALSAPFARTPASETTDYPPPHGSEYEYIMLLDS